MLIQLADILDEPFHWQETRTIDAASLGRDLLVALGPVSWSGHICREAEGFLLTAALDYEQQLACPRCLKPTNMPVSANVQLLIQARRNEPTVGEVELEEKDLDALFVEGEELDTEPILIEQIQLNVPMRKLCQEDCRGLCPSCGVDRNSEECDCAEDTMDPRWEALKNLGANDA